MKSLGKNSKISSAQILLQLDCLENFYSLESFYFCSWGSSSLSLETPLFPRDLPAVASTKSTLGVPRKKLSKNIISSNSAAHLTPWRVFTFFSGLFLPFPGDSTFC
jgi:hypothetical protein